jgi:hypothetical protein
MKVCPNPSLVGEKHNHSRKSSTHTIVHAAEIASALFREPISKGNQHIDLARHASTPTMMPDSSTSCAHPSSTFVADTRCTTLMR